MRILIRATNWLGDAVMSLPALRAVKANYSTSTITLLAKRSVADLYARESYIDEIIVYEGNRWDTARALRKGKYQVGILLPNSFDSALIFRLAGIPQIIGYDTDFRRPLLTRPISVPSWKGSVHERFYYLELLHEARIIDGYHAGDHPIVLDCAAAAATVGRQAYAEHGIAAPVIGVSPGAAYGNAKRWLPERFAESAACMASQMNATVVLFGAAGDAASCAAVEDNLKRRDIATVNFCGSTTLRQFIDLAAACGLFLTNDSGAMHVASALGVPTVAVFGATNPKTTGPAGPIHAILRQKVDCSPCFKRDCPIDHRCMTAVTARQVVEASSELIQLGKNR